MTDIHPNCMPTDDSEPCEALQKLQSDMRRLRTVLELIIELEQRANKAQDKIARLARGALNATDEP